MEPEVAMEAIVDMIPGVERIIKVAAPNISPSSRGLPVAAGSCHNAKGAAWLKSSTLY